MRILVAWDSPDQADLMGLYLGTEGNEIKICLTADEFTGEMVQGKWDVVLLALTFPKTADDGYAYFQKILEKLPGVPTVLGCRQNEMLSLPRFMTHGLRH